LLVVDYVDVHAMKFLVAGGEHNVVSMVLKTKI